MSVLFNGFFKNLKCGPELAASPGRNVQDFRSTLDLQNQDVRVGLCLTSPPGDSHAQWSLKNSGLEKQSPDHWQDLRIISGVEN